MKHLLPAHIKPEFERRLKIETARKEHAEAPIGDSLDSLYATESLTTAMTKLSSEAQFRERFSGHPTVSKEGLYYAIPMRHNWGVLAIARLLPEPIQRYLCETAQGFER